VRAQQEGKNEISFQFFEKRTGTGNLETGGVEISPCLKKIMEVPTYGKIILSVYLS
jgi:hypothetical protein